MHNMPHPNQGYHPANFAGLVFFHVFVVMYEEPTLKQTFGTEYESFRTNVPRWIPRLTPWRAA